MCSKLVIVALLVLALSVNVEGACDQNACDSEMTTFLRLSDNSNVQEVCQSANAYLDCVKRLSQDCGADFYASQIENIQNLMNKQSCGSAGLFVCIPLLMLLLFLSKSVN